MQWILSKSGSLSFAPHQLCNFVKIISSLGCYLFQTYLSLCSILSAPEKDTRVSHRTNEQPYCFSLVNLKYDSQKLKPICGRLFGERLQRQDLGSNVASCSKRVGEINVQGSTKQRPFKRLSYLPRLQLYSLKDFFCCLIN